MKKTKGFGLISLLVVVAIIILSVSFFTKKENVKPGEDKSPSPAGVQTRDMQRRNDLRMMAAALEMYDLDHNKYPIYSDWIIFSQVMREMGSKYGKSIPSDPLNKENFHYYYRSKNGEDYQVVAHLEGEQQCFVISESEEVAYTLDGNQDCRQVIKE